MRFRSAYDGRNNEVSAATGLVCLSPNMAQQQFAEECDINTIVRRFGLTGQLPQNANMPQVGDFSGVIDFQTAMQQIKAAEAEFMLFPAEIRARFNHDPQQMIRFTEDRANREEAIKLGMIPKPVELTRDGSALPGTV